MNFEAVSGVGIRSSCTANLLGVTLSGNLSFALSGGRPTLAARVLDVNLTTLVSNARMVGPLPPAMASRLSSLTFPSFSLDSYGPDGAWLCVHGSLCRMLHEYNGRLFECVMGRDQCLLQE